MLAASKWTVDAYFVYPLILNLHMCLLGVGANCIVDIDYLLYSSYHQNVFAIKLTFYIY